MTSPLRLLAAIAVLSALLPTSRAAPLGTIFTYQGRLDHNSAPANGLFDLKFELYADEVGGSPVQPAQEHNRSITDGLFSVDLNFGGASVFDGRAYWLQISARQVGSPSWIQLPNRSVIRPAPYAIHALSAATVKDGGVTNASIFPGAVTASKLAPNAVGLGQLNIFSTTAPVSGQVVAYDGTGLSWQFPGGWRLGANSSVHYTAGNVGIGTQTPASRLTVRTSGYGIEHTDGSVRMGTFVGPGGGYLGTINSYPMSFFAGGAEAVLTLALNENVGIGTAAPTAKLHVAGNIAATAITTTGDASVRALTIRGGADLAEPFAMSHAGVEPGTVVVIDAEQPGRLKASTQAYDKKVAGIVSGANGISPGISMIQEDRLEAGENVALCGRVFVKADTSAGSIEPGDLLTSSSRPGRAMKATDWQRAQGAILGKAMTSLAEGEGMVLVLVTLQ